MVVVGVAFARPVSADEFKPAYLQLVQRDATDYDVLWKLPALDETTTLKLRPVFPTGTEEVAERSSTYANGAAVQRWRVRVPNGLAGKSIAFPELATQRVDVLVRVVRTDGTTQLGRLTPWERTFEVTASPGAMEVARTYTLLGIEHILLGFDHLLFVLALLLLVRGVRRLVATITAFTVAHSITLALATLGVVQVPGPPVEACIALSIVFVASEVIHGLQGRPGLTVRYPWLVAFAFGLLHGLGFAGALAEVGLPENQVPTALLFFNIGVEIGQLLFVGAVLAALAGWRRLLSGLRMPRPAWAPMAAAYAIGGLASFWLIERIASFY
ncbi:MAG: HupE/UreJ family protein [Betaproteobacteria bacterium]